MSYSSTVRNHVILLYSTCSVHSMSFNHSHKAFSSSPLYDTPPPFVRCRPDNV